MPDPVISVVNVSKHFGALVAVDNISFEVNRGTTVALLGGNGAGKTTTLSMLLGLLLPTAGQINIFGVDVQRQRYRVLPRMNFSSPYVDLPRRLTVRENLTVYAHLYGLRRIRERLRQLAEELNLGEIMRRPYGQLSAGQKTRVAIAKSLLNEPELLLFDEPTASLDPDTADYVRGMLENYKTRTGATILLASHNMSEVERLCDDVLMLRAGKLVDRGTPAALLTRYGRRNMEEVFIDIARERHLDAALDARKSAK
ncbi:MAG: ABC transporter [Candidatus Muproteobacteria bacterium RBG_16_65_31]|uniref:ABC transporter n=1 Tax=Candidatus Muproteobacteria bacterium RBG_16_65_31 TaxID=1817759 RepID=A0A1F6TJJ1_9PROT|nr:MAG: ABC transporter [Candidatus Muproteobacteria bacterium RBG_16_65_31]